MNVNAKITSDRILNIHFNFPENTETTKNIWVGYIEIYNTQSYLDGVPIYWHTYDADIATDETTYEDVSEYITDFSISENEINVFETLMYNGQTDKCHHVDMLNDIIIVNVTFGHSVSYLANTSCCGNSSTKSIPLYYARPLYENAMNALGGCSCKDMCEDNLPYGFMYALLKKKAIDACLVSGHYDMACRYYMKFFKTDPCNCVKKSCGCGSSSQDVKANAGVVKKKNCGCNGNVS